MGRRIITVLEVLVVMTLFSLFAALIITTNTNDAIIENTEEFVELVRYKGCITEDMYYDFIEDFNSPVDVSFSVTRKPTLGSVTDGDTLEFTNDVVEAITGAEGIYKMSVGDEIEVVVRKPSGNYYDTIVGMVAGQKAASDGSPIIAIKGGMILNTQYQV